MDMKLLNEEIDNYLNKYKRFMTKDIYITSSMYDIFVYKYRYLYEECYSRKDFFENSLKYKNIIKIKKDKNKLLKKHNRSYIDNKLVRYRDYFDINLDVLQKDVIICEEDNLYVCLDKMKIEDTIYGKVMYLTDVLGVNSKDVVVITLNKNLVKRIDNLGVLGYSLSEFYLSVFKKNGKVISDRDSYYIISNYIKNILFKDKKKFYEFYVRFSSMMKLTDEYSLFDSYSDYHNYMYKREYVSSFSKDIDEFVKSRVRKRKENLVSINGELCKSKVYVDVVNFLYLNSISYDMEDGNVSIYQNDKCNSIKFVLGKDMGNEVIEDNFIVLDITCNNYLVMLKDNLVKYGYVMERKDMSLVYERLRKTDEDDYIKDLINLVIIPFVNSFKVNSDKLSFIMDDKVLMDIYNYYFLYLKENNLISYYDIVNDYKCINKRDLKVGYKYIIIDNSDLYEFENDYIRRLFNCKMVIIDNYNKCLCDLKIDNNLDLGAYLESNKQIPISNCYVGFSEFIGILNDFVSSNNNQIRKRMQQLKVVEGIYVYVYDDCKIDTIYNKFMLLDDIINGIDGSKILFIGNVSNDIEERYISKNIGYNDDSYNLYDNCIFLYDDICDSYLKLLFYMAFTNIRDRLYVLISRGKLNDFLNYLGNSKSVYINK